MVAATKSRKANKKPAKKTGAAAVEVISDSATNGHESGGLPKRGEMSDAIRKYWIANQNAKPKQILEALAAEGKTVAIGLINSVIAAQKKKLGLTGKKKNADKATKGPGRPAKSVVSSTGSVGAIQAAQGLIEATGGVDEAIAFLIAVKKILG